MTKNCMTKWAEYKTIVATMRAHGDKGTVGKLLDVLVRDYVLADGIKNTADVRCRKAGQIDWSIRVNGKMFHGETKTNSGEVVKGFDLTEADATIETVMEGADFIAYSPEANFANEGNFEKLMLVFTHEQFFEMLTAVRKGGKPFVKAAKGGTRLNIQTWTACPLGRFYDFAEQNDIPTLEDFVKRMRG